MYRTTDKSIIEKFCSLIAGFPKTADILEINEEHTITVYYDVEDCQRSISAYDYTFLFVMDDKCVTVKARHKSWDGMKNIVIKRFHTGEDERKIKSEKESLEVEKKYLESLTNYYEESKKGYEALSVLLKDDMNRYIKIIKKYEAYEKKYGIIHG